LAFEVGADGGTVVGLRALVGAGGAVLRDGDGGEDDCGAGGEEESGGEDGAVGAEVHEASLFG